MQPLRLFYGGLWGSHVDKYESDDRPRQRGFKPLLAHTAAAHTLECASVRAIGARGHATRTLQEVRSDDTAIRRESPTLHHAVLYVIRHLKVFPM